MHTALISKEQANFRETKSREKGLAQPHNIIQHIEGYDLIFQKNSKQDLNSSIIETNIK
jgi:hypothetical protein